MAYRPTSYSPTQYAYPAQNFWNQLLDGNGRPSETFCRFSDALFFHLDANTNTSYRNSGYIEPMKWVLLIVASGDDAELVNWIASKNDVLAGYYQLAGVPYKQVTLRDGTSIPVLDRVAFLHFMLWAFRLKPSEGLSDMNKYLAAFSLRDPATNEPFPHPVPQTAITNIAPDANAIYSFGTWQGKIMFDFHFQRAQARFSAGTPTPFAATLSFAQPTYTPSYTASPTAYGNPVAMQMAQAQLQVAQLQAAQMQAAGTSSSKVELLKTGINLVTNLATGGFGGLSFS